MNSYIPIKYYFVKRQEDVLPSVAAAHPPPAQASQPRLKLQPRHLHHLLHHQFLPAVSPVCAVLHSLHHSPVRPLPLQPVPLLALL